MIDRSILMQLLRYVGVGIVANSIGYISYLSIIFAGMGHKFSMSAVYLAGFIVSFYGNRKFTFNHDGRIAITGVKFSLIYGFGYLVNVCLLLLFVDLLGYAHGLVQLISIGVVAAVNFTLLKYFVFVGVSDDESLQS